MKQPFFRGTNVYWNSYSSLLNFVRSRVETQYTIDENEWFVNLSVGGEPYIGQMKSVHITLFDKLTNKESKKQLHIQIYNMSSDQDYAKKTFELNFYIQ